ncbi:MAG: WD40 repeat domain-containing protein [Gemmataceae bacterium]|nr:WD40 repeat domain-containing protein [Gemmataceae bacterium]
MIHTQSVRMLIGLCAATIAAAVADSRAVAGDDVEVLKAHTDKVTCVAISPDGARALSTSDDRTVREWDLAAGKVLRVLKDHKDYTLAAAYLPGGAKALSAGGGLWKGKHFSLGSDFALRLWDLEKASPSRTFSGHSGPVWAIAVSRDGRTALTGSGGWTDPSSAQPQPKPLGFGASVWNLEAGSHRELKGHLHWVQAVAIAADGRRGVTGSWDKSVRLWDLAGATLLREFKGHNEMVNSVALSPSGATILSGSSAGAIFVWNAETGQRIRELRGHRKRVWSLAFSQDGKTVLSASADNTIRLWDVAVGKELHILKGHTDEVRRAVFSPDEQWILSGSHDKTLRLWKRPK